jgi:hypothetical protein
VYASNPHRPKAFHGQSIRHPPFRFRRQIIKISLEIILDQFGIFDEDCASHRKKFSAVRVLQAALKFLTSTALHLSKISFYDLVESLHAAFSLRLSHDALARIRSIGDTLAGAAGRSADWISYSIPVG